MGLFEAVQYVTGIFSLLAFVAAVGAVMTNKYINHKEGLIKTVPEKERAHLVEKALEGFVVRTEDLTKQQKYELLMRQMDHRTARWQKMYRLMGLATVVLSTSFVIAYVLGSDKAIGFGHKKEIDELDRVMVSNYQQEMFGDAEAAADAILEKDPNYYRALSVKGSVAIYDGEPKTAVKFFKKGLDNAPESRTLKRNLAYALIETNDYEQAIQIYESIDDGKTESVNSLGRAYLYGGYYEKALDKLKVVPNIYESGFARILEATAYSRLSEAAPENEKSIYLKKAKEKFEEGLSQDPIYWEGVLTGKRVNKNTTYRLENQYLGQFLE